MCKKIDHFPEDADYEQDTAEYLLRESASPGHDGAAQWGRMRPIGTPVPTTQSSTQQVPLCCRMLMGCSPPGSPHSSGDPLGYPSVATSRCSGSANGTFVWCWLSPRLVPAAEAQPELVGA